MSDNLFVVDDAANAIRNYAKQGYDLVIAHGSQYGGSVQQIAPQSPRTRSRGGRPGHVRSAERVRLLGLAPGRLRQGRHRGAEEQEKVIGVVGPIEVGDAKLYVDGFKAGATAPSVKTDVNVTYTGSFSDVACGRGGSQFVAQNADVMTGSAQMVVGAVGVARENNLSGSGRSRTRPRSRRTSSSPRRCTTGGRAQADHHAHPGRHARRRSYINLKNGGEVIEYNKAAKTPTQDPGDGDAAVAGIVDGKIGVPRTARRRSTRPPRGTAGAAGDAPPCSRCAASRSGSPGCSPTTGWTSTCGPARCTRSSARTAPARAR